MGPSRWTGYRENLLQFLGPNSLRRNATAGSSVTPWVAASAGTNGGNECSSPPGPTRKNSFRPTGPIGDPRPVGEWRNLQAGGLCAGDQFRPLRGTADLFTPVKSGPASSPGFSRVPVFCEAAAEGDAAEDPGMGHRVRVIPCDPVPRSSFTSFTFPSTTIIRQVSSVGQWIQPAPRLLLSL